VQRCVIGLVRTLLVLGRQNLSFANKSLATTSAESFVDVLVGTAVLTDTGIEVPAQVGVLVSLLVLRCWFDPVFPTIVMLVFGHRPATSFGVLMPLAPSFSSFGLSG
jgi:hypothetical protein